MQPKTETPVSAQTDQDSLPDSADRTLDEPTLTPAEETRLYAGGTLPDRGLPDPGGMGAYC